MFSWSVPKMLSLFPVPFHILYATTWSHNNVHNILFDIYADDTHLHLLRTVHLVAPAL